MNTSEPSRREHREISVVCVVTPYAGDLAAVHREFRRVVAEDGRTAEFIYVIDGPWTGAEESISKLSDPEFSLRILRLAKGFGEATALQVGFANAAGRYVLTIPDRPMVEAAALKQVLERLDRGADCVVTRREPRSDALLNRIQSRVFHGLVQRLTGQSFHDMACCLRGFTREAALKLDLYGDQHRFIPVIALRSGHGVVEIPAAQHPENRGLRIYSPGVYLRRLLDILNIYFLARFTRKPLRFFGLIGSFLGGIGFVMCAVLAAQRLFGHTALANRPVLLLAVLLVVLGVQIVSIGLLGEIIIFLSSRREVPQVLEGNRREASVTEPEVVSS